MTNSDLKHYQMGLAIARLLSAQEYLSEVRSAETWLGSDASIEPDIDSAIKIVERLISKALDHIRPLLPPDKTWEEVAR